MRINAGMIAHDDGLHVGSAKRDTVYGVAALEGNGSIIAQGWSIYLARDGANDIALRERTSDEAAMVIRRTGANAYTMYNNTVAGGKILQDSSMKNIASGIAGLGTILQLSGAVTALFNLAKLGGTNLFTNNVIGTGNVVFNTGLGTIQLNIPANADTAETELKDAIALTLLPRICMFKINALTIAGAATMVNIGFKTPAGSHAARIRTVNGGTNWVFTTVGAGTTDTAIAAVSVNDVFLIYASSGRCSLWKNGAHVVTHTTNIPTNPVSPMVELWTDIGQGAGNTLTVEGL